MPPTTCGLPAALCRGIYCLQVRTLGPREVRDLTWEVEVKVYSEDNREPWEV